MFSEMDNVVRQGVHGVVDIYSGAFVPGTSGKGGDYSQVGGMNAEHIWPQFFFEYAPTLRSDLHNLLPASLRSNMARSSLPYGETNGRSRHSDVFEPPEASKGQVARAILYFYTRYYDREITGGSYTQAFFKERIEMFLRWNREHPPTADELRRNDLIEHFQGNRNPFVDAPALADRVGVEGFGGAAPVSSAPGRLSALDFTPLDFTQH
jgi:hypothetical protein